MKKRLKNEKIRYWFDNIMSGGIFKLIKMLGIVTIIVVFIVGVVIAFVDSDSGHNVLRGIWLSLTHIIDPGQLGDDWVGTNGTAYKLTMVLVTLAGLLITSTLIGVISNAIDSKIHTLQRGKSYILEKNHVIVLGCSSGLNTIISELIEANSNQPDKVVVVMDDKDPKDVMDEHIRQKFPDTKTTRIICRCGGVANFSALEVCSFGTCRSVIINAESDAVTIKSLLAVTNLLKKYNNTKAYIVAVIHNQENVLAAEVAGEGYVEILSYRDTMSRIIAHTCRYAGLSKVYTEIFDFGGSELYIEKHPSVVGVTMGEVNRYFAESTVVGIKRESGKCFLNPPADTVIEAGDELILFAEDDGVSKAMESPASICQEKILECPKVAEKQKKRLLIIGYSDKISQILMEEDQYLAPGSTATIALLEENRSREKELLNLPLNNIEQTVCINEAFNRNTLEELLEGKPESILVLGESSEDIIGADAEKRDANIILLLLHLKQLIRERNERIDVTSEMLRVENQELAEITDVNDFVVGSNITSLMLTQICQTRELHSIFKELLSKDGAEIYIRPAGNYIHLGMETDIYTAGAAAAKQGEVLIGYRTYNEETKNFDIISNPPKDTVVNWKASDSFIVFAED